MENQENQNIKKRSMENRRQVLNALLDDYKKSYYTKGNEYIQNMIEALSFKSNRRRTYFAT